MILLDTDVLIRIRYVRLPADEVALSALSFAELRFGIERATEPDVRRERQMDLARVTTMFHSDWLPFDTAAADSYARLAAHVATRRPAHARSTDIMLAGHAYALGAAFLTFNPKDFELVSDEVEIIVPELR
ncbi:PIN domain-containing protein [Microbacterium sp. NPDC055988]|uniref:PIN domain-containing protein n=1 Tax=Microbacterium sp. NPDC055988 TaxID=3345671 RepID=UPI0035DF5BCC